MGIFILKIRIKITGIHKYIIMLYLFTCLLRSLLCVCLSLQCLILSLLSHIFELLFCFSLAKECIRFRWCSSVNFGLRFSSPRRHCLSSFTWIFKHYTIFNFSAYLLTEFVFSQVVNVSSFSYFPIQWSPYFDGGVIYIPFLIARTWSIIPAPSSLTPVLVATSQQAFSHAESILKKRWERDNLDDQKYRSYR